MACLAGPSVLADLRYETEIAGVDDSALADLLGEVSELKSLQDRLPASEQALRRRAERDLELLSDAAHSLGYWDAQFSYRIELARNRRHAAKVVVTAEPGPLYHVAEVTVLGPERRPLVIPRGPKKAEQSPGTAAASRRAGAHRAGRRDRNGAARLSRTGRLPVREKARSAGRHRP